MEIEYIDTDNEQVDKNFILPETEKVINQIIDEFTYFFFVCRFVLQFVYIIYLVLRFIYFDFYNIFTLVLLGICFIQFSFFIINIIKQKKINVRILKTIGFAKCLVSFSVAFIVAMDIFGHNETIYRWQAITCVLLCLGWILSFTGRIFASTVPRYADMILTSFKKDIDPHSLASRSLTKVKEAAGYMAKRKAVRSWRNIKTWFFDLIDN